MSAAGAGAAEPVRCEPTPVHWERHERFPSLEAPWVAVEPHGGIVGFLYYYSTLFTPEQEHAVLFTGGSTPDGTTTKILWATAEAEGDDVLDVKASLRSGDAYFTRLFEARRSNAAGDDTRWFPALLELPEPGCWDFLLRTGSVLGKLTFLVRDSSR